jgi:hypothetical protein
MYSDKDDPVARTVDASVRTRRGNLYSEDSSRWSLELRV